MIQIEYIQQDSDFVIENPSYKTFSAGEEHINLKKRLGELKSITLSVRLDSSLEIMRLLLITSSLREQYKGVPIDLMMPYVPYSRQDRFCNKGDAFGLKVFCDIINSQNYRLVTILDPHSDVTPALLNNVKVISQDSLTICLYSRLGGQIKYIVSPDSGATKKTFSFYSKFKKLLTSSKGKEEGDKLKLIQCLKIRDPSNGEIIRTDVLIDEIEGDCLIVDDICDGGRTFKDIADILRSKGANKVYLFVSHAIISNGFDAVGVDEIFTTDSFEELDDGRKVINRRLY